MKRILVVAAGCAAFLIVVVLLAAAIQLARFEMPSELDPADERAPSRLLSRPLLAQRGTQLGEQELAAHLIATSHRRVAPGHPVGVGEFTREGDVFRIGRRAFEHPGGHEPAGQVEIELSRSGRVVSLVGTGGERLHTLRLEPAVLDAFHPPDGRDRRRVRLEDLPRQLVDAVLAIEDQRFYEHRGLDLRRIAGALVANLEAGRIVQGGSTLTQQLVKNLYLTRERSLFRKLQEIPLALWIEWWYSKQEILEAYLNEAYLGQSGRVAIHGVDRASEYWFGKRVESLELHESALLAGMLRGPSLYSPSRDPQTALVRRNLVLAQMHELALIDDALLAAASKQALGVVPPQRIPQSARYFTDYVSPGLAARYEREQLERGGLRIHTSLDLRLQRLAEQAVRHGVEQLEQQSPALARDDLPLQAALVALDARSGEVLAMVGGRDYGSTQWNRASDARRQPGSVFKMVAALAALSPPHRGEQPAFTLVSLIDDAPIALATPEGDWLPGNHDDAFRGPVTLREVIEHSLNVPMIRIGLTLGPRRVVLAARRLGIESPLHAVPSLVLGTSEVTLLEMTRAYGVLAAEGWRSELRPLLEITDARGEVLESHEPAGSHALDPAEAHLLTSVLRGVVDRGTGYGVRARGFNGPVAGKTGTTDDYRDAWFIGYVPDLAVGVWVGFDDGRTLRHSGSRAALPIFADFLRQALGSLGGPAFPVPPGLETAMVAAAEGYPSGLLCNGEREIFLEGSAPRERCSPWEWLSGDRVLRVGELSREPEGLPASVGAGPDPDERRRPALRLRLPPWLNPFREADHASDE